MTEEKKGWTYGMGSTEDWWAAWIALFFVFVGLIAAVTQIDLTGWIVGFSKWVDPSKGIHAAHKDLMGPAASIVVTYVIFTIATAIGAISMKWDLGKYLKAWTVIYWLTVFFYFVGQNAYITATSLDRVKFGIPWSLSIGGAFFIIALAAGLILGNLAPKGFRDFIKAGAKPEWYIKIAIVTLGTKLGLKAIEATGFAFHLLIAGMCATIAAYMIFWPLAYTISRKIFKLSKEWAACLASGISICGVSAAIATAGSVRARPIVPIMVSSLIVVFAVGELVILPAALVHFWSDEPITAGASLGLMVKTDGADAASGAVLDELIRAKAAVAGINYEEGWILSSAIMTKIWIDMFIGIWAFVLAVIWVYHIERKPGEKVEKMQMWWRFPKFVVGYFVAWFVIMALGLSHVLSLESLKFGLKPIEGAMRHLFFMLTFMSIGIVTDFRELRREGIGRLTAAYATILIIIIIPIGLFIAWLFHHGLMPPTV